MSPQDTVDLPKTEVMTRSRPTRGCSDDDLNTQPATTSSVRGDKSRQVSMTVKKCILVGCCFLMFMSVLGFLAGLGVLFVEIIDTFQSTRAMGSLIQSVCMGLVFGTGAITSPLIAKVGVGPVCVVGGVMAAGGLVASAFAPTLQVLIFTVGVVTGCGLCTNSMVPLILVGEVFDKRRSLALTIVSIGSGVGALVFPVLNSALVDAYGWRGAFLILSGISLQATPMGMLLAVISRELKTYKENLHMVDMERISGHKPSIGGTDINQLESTEKLSVQNRIEDDGKCDNILSQSKEATHSFDNAAFEGDFKAQDDQNINHSKLTSSDANVLASESKWKSFLSTLHLELFTQVSFLVLAINVVLITALFPSINFFLVDMAMSKGFDAKTGSFLLSLVGFCNLAGRFLYLFIRPLIKISQVAIFATLGFVVSVTVLIFVWADSYVTLLVAVISYGLPFGGISVCYPSLMFEIAGPERYSSAVGYAETLSGVGALIGGPIAGFLKDLTDSYDTVVFAATSAGLFCSLSFYALLIKQKCSEGRTYFNKETVCSRM